MEIADSFCCEFYRAERWDSMVSSRLRIYHRQGSTGLEIVTTQQDIERDTDEQTKLELTRVDLDTVERLQSHLVEWLDGDRTSSKEMRTSPVEGTYEDTEELSSIRHVDIEIERDGLRMVGIKAGNRPVSGAVKIPSASTVRNGNISRCGHLERINSLLEVFLSGVQTEEQDVIQSTRYLIDPETHFHNRVSERCLDQLSIDDHMGVIQAAGTALEAHLKEEAPPPIVNRAQNTTDLVNQAFRGDGPPFRWGYDSGEQEGIHQLYAGAIKAFRNPTSHDRGDPDRDRYLDDINERDALDALCLFNFLIRRLETYGSADLEYEGQ